MVTFTEALKRFNIDYELFKKLKLKYIQIEQKAA